MTAPIRTYGTYRFIDPRFSNAEHRNGAWMLDIEPAVRARAKKVLARVRQSRSTYITVAHTLEVARDLVWFMDRFPLRPTDTRSAEVLDEAYHRHIELEQQVGQIIAGTAPLPTAPPTIAKKPREYQLQALQLVKTRGRILLGDDVGLGKTFTSLLTTTLDGALPAVVVPPTHLPPRWMTELEDAFPTLTVELAAKTTPGAHIFEGRLADVTIVPYSKLAGWSGALAPHIRTVIFDEAQELRHGIGTEKGAAAAGLAEDATYVIGATATPVYNYGSEIWNIADILSPGELGTRDEFLREWGGYTMSNGRSTVRDPHALGSYMRESGFLLARTRTEVGRELPKTIKHTMSVETDQGILDKVKTDIRALAELILAADTDRQDRFQAGGKIDWMLRHATGVAKARYVAEFCKLLLESEQKIVIWAWHRDVYDILMTALAAYNPRLYTGTETPKHKAAAEAAFTAPYLDPNDPDVTQQQLDQQCRVLIMSLRSGAGVDGLQKVASVGVFAELDWSPQVHEQAIGRLRRDGMDIDSPPVAYFLVTDDGSDPALMEVLGIKRQQAETLMSKDGQLFNNSTDDPARARRLARQVLGLPTEPENDP
ncbi:DEAD/DEAH box helicase [Microbacterium proteolyticum]|uniref:SNF2-related protein n=1 Tax=Microbacterium proteolyticum TaxID=1572644 RepID=UPI00345B6533